MDAWERGDVPAVVGMLAEDATFAMPPLASWFGGREEIRDFLVFSPMSGDWEWKAIRTQANGQPALAFYTWDADEQVYLPFALNVLTFRGSEIADVTAFITRSTDDVPDRAAVLRMPEQPHDDRRLAAAFQNLGLPDRLER